MSQYALRLPDSLLEMARKSAECEHASMNQLFVSAIAEKLSTLEAEHLLRSRGVLADDDDFRAILGRVPTAEITKGDEI